MLSNDDLESIMIDVESKGHKCNDFTNFFWLDNSKNFDALKTSTVPIIDDFYSSTKKFRICVADAGTKSYYRLYVGYSEQYEKLNILG